MRPRRSIPILLAIVLMLGCAAKKPIHPGALNSFDSQAYDTLLVTQAALEEAKAQLGSHPEVKDVLNQAIASYNTAQSAYKVYHLSGGAGSQAALQAQLLDVVARVAAVQKAFGRQP